MDDSEQSAQSNIGYWLKWIKSARENKHAKRHRKEARAAWDEYEKEPGIDTENRESYKRCNPAYFSACKTLEPAYYAKTPKTVGRRRDGVDDPAALLAALYAKRLGDHLVDSCEFDECFSKVVQEFMHADKATTQICYEVETKIERVDVVDDSQIPEGVELLQDEQGYYYEIKSAENQRIYPKAVLYDEIIHTPSAKCWSEITEIGYKFSLSKDDALKRFNLEGKEISWQKGKSSDDDETQDDKDSQLEVLEGWEIYCKKTKRVYWVSPSCYPSGFLDVKKDEWGIRNFFPSPRAILGSSPAKHLYPTPIYIQLKHIIKEMHSLHGKIFELIDGIRRRALIDGSCPELVKAFDDLEDNEFIVVENMQRIVEAAKGAQNLVWYLPVQELVSAITELVSLDQFFSEKFDLGFGVPDILRGVSDPTTTASAERISSGAAHDRFRYQKRQVQKLASDTIEMMIDLALKVYSPEKLFRIFRVEHTPEAKMHHDQAMAILINDEERLVRVDIQTDSMSFVNEQIENQNRTSVIQTVVGGIKEIGGLLQNGAPEYAAVALHTVVHALDGLRGGEEFIEEIKSQTNGLIEKAMQPKEGPPPPDYEAMKLEIQAQKNMMTAQVDMRELDQKDFKLQLEARDQQLNEIKQMALEQVQSISLQIESRDQQIREAKQIHDAELATFKAQTQAVIDRALLVLEQQRVAIEEFNSRAQAQESALEEIRLAREALMNAAMETSRLKPEAPQIVVEAPLPTPVNVIMPKQEERPRSKRVGRIIRDELGNARVEIEDELPPLI